MKEILKNCIKKKMKKYNLIQNINLDLTRNQKKILISYIDSSFKMDFSGDIGHTNILEANQIIKEFIDRDFCIDVIHCQEVNGIEKIKNKKYDVIFGFGKPFQEITKQNSEATKILYMTEHHPEISRKAEQERIDYFYKRKDKKLKLSRSGVHYQESSFKNIDYIIALGDEFPLKKYGKPIFSLNPTGLLNDNYSFEKRSYKKSKKNFLWFGSNGAIHKGLDILLDIFEKRDDITLHVCGFNKKDRKLLKLPKKSNIIDYGKIDVKKDLFEKLVSVCSYQLAPSCSEAMSTSVLTCMLHGLIPVVIKNAGLNKLEDKAIFLEDYKLDYIEDQIDKLIKKDNEELAKLHKEIFEFSRKEFTIKKFKENFCEVLNSILVL